MRKETIMTEKVVIIGSGPAGHTAAIYTARANLSPVMFEGLFAGGVAAGGQLTTTTEVENFPGFPEGISGSEMMEQFRKQSERFGTRIHTETVTEINLSTTPLTIKTDSQTVEAHTVILATGATARRMSVPGEETLWQKGISACAVCDGALPIFRDKELVVIGGGDSAVEEASHLTKYGSKVYLVHRRDTLRASKIMQQRALEHPKIEILWDTVVLEAKGSNRLESVTLQNVKTSESRELPCAGLFYAIGHQPNTAFLEGQLELDATGYIITRPDSTATSLEGIFACGDVQDPVWRQAITAAGSGCMAALEAERYLTEKNIG
jgi:thioredoxin reductase (NADPH)